MSIRYVFIDDCFDIIEECDSWEEAREMAEDANYPRTHAVKIVDGLWIIKDENA